MNIPQKKILLIGDSITRNINLGPEAEIVTFPGINTSSLLSKIRKDSTKYTGYDIVVALIGANDMGKVHVEEIVDDLHELLCTLQDINEDAAVYCCEVLPRRRWTRQVELFDSAHPNQCAKNYNEMMTCAVGAEHVIPLYDDFCCNKKTDAFNGMLFRPDGLHPNGTGKQLLSALIRFIIYKDSTPARLTRQKTNEEEPSDGFEDVRAFRPLVGGSGICLNYGMVRRSSIHVEYNAQIVPATDDLQAFPPLFEELTSSSSSISCFGYAEALLKPPPTPAPVTPLVPLPSKETCRQPCSTEKKLRPAPYKRQLLKANIYRYRRAIAFSKLNEIRTLKDIREHKTKRSKASLTVPISQTEHPIDNSRNKFAVLANLQCSDGEKGVITVVNRVKSTTCRQKEDQICKQQNDNGADEILCYEQYGGGVDSDPDQEKKQDNTKKKRRKRRPQLAKKRKGSRPKTATINAVQDEAEHASPNNQATTDSPSARKFGIC